MTCLTPVDQCFLASMSSSLVTQHLLFPQLLLHMWDQAAVLEDGENFLGKSGKVFLFAQPAPRFCPHQPSSTKRLERHQSMEPTVGPHPSQVPWACLLIGSLVFVNVYRPIALMWLMIIKLGTFSMIISPPFLGCKRHSCLWENRRLVKFLS